MTASPRPVDEVLGSFVGSHIPGGCDDCDAFQTVELDRIGVWHITVHHDDWCPWLRAREAR